MSILRLAILILLILPYSAMSQSKIELFNHKNLEGWYAYEPGSGKHNNAADVFYADSEMIRLYGEKAGYLMTKQEFRNFRLTVEFKWNTDSTFKRKNNRKNSGIMYMVPPETADTLWPKGIQFQVKDGATGDFIFLHNITLTINGERTKPGKSVVSKRFINAANPVGDWNTVIITSLNGKITQQLNGKIVNEGTEPSESKGRILLQYEGYPIDFRKVTIEKL